MLSLGTRCPTQLQWDPRLSSEENAKLVSVRATETAGHDLSTQTSVNIVIGPVGIVICPRAQMKHTQKPAKGWAVDERFCRCCILRLVVRISY